MRQRQRGEEKEASAVETTIYSGKEGRKRGSVLEYDDTHRNTLENEGQRKSIRTV